MHIAKLGFIHCFLFFFSSFPHLSLSFAPSFSRFYVIHPFAWIHSAVKVHAHHTVKRTLSEINSVARFFHLLLHLANPLIDRIRRTPIVQIISKRPNSFVSFSEPFAVLRWPKKEKTKMRAIIKRGKKKTWIEWDIAGGQHMSVKQVFDNRKARRMKCGLRPNAGRIHTNKCDRYRGISKTKTQSIKRKSPLRRRHLNVFLRAGRFENFWCMAEQALHIRQQ